jgi:hypothetical protein
MTYCMYDNYAPSDSNGRQPVYREIADAIAP